MSAKWRGAVCTTPKLSALGPANLANSLSASELIQAYVDAELLQSPLDFAISILFSNLELASNRPHTAAIVTGDHIYPSEIINPAQYNRVRELATIISRQGKASSTGGWATISDSVDKDGNPLYFEFDLAERKVGDRVLEYKWSEMTTDAATVPNVGAMRTASNDTELQNQTWSVNQGKTASEHQDNSAPA